MRGGMEVVVGDRVAKDAGLKIGASIQILSRTFE